MNLSASSAKNGPNPDPFDEEFQKHLEYLAIISRRIFSGSSRAERRSRKTGSGIEFADYRQYSPGDDYRYLDWNVYGRLGRLLLRLFEEEEDLWIYLILDCSGSMRSGEPSKLNYCKKLLSVIAYIGLSNLDRISVVTIRDSIVSRLAPTRGKKFIFRIFEFLRPLDASGRTNLKDALKEFVTKNRRPGVAVLISDLYDPEGFQSGINLLRYHRFEPYVIHIVDPRDLHPGLHGDILLEDIETGEIREITVTPQLLERYIRAHREYCRQISDFCTQKHIPLFSLSTKTTFEDAVLNILRHGGMVG